MNGRTAMTGVVTGLLGLAAGGVGYFTGEPLFGVVAGFLAVAAALTAVQLGRQLDEQASIQRLVEDELRAVRSEAEEAEERVRSEMTYDADDYDEGALADTLTDPVTGLFSESFFDVTVDSRIAAARRHLRPVAVVLLEVVNGLPDGEPNAVEPELVAEAVRATLRDADTACRLRSGYFALLLEDTPENGAIWTVERVRRHLLTVQDRLTLWAGVACYPAHAFSANEIMTAAQGALESAKEWRQDRIEVATAAAD